jgi:hypothetical protein
MKQRLQAYEGIAQMRIEGPDVAPGDDGTQHDQQKGRCDPSNDSPDDLHVVRSAVLSLASGRASGSRPPR